MTLLSDVNFKNVAYTGDVGSFDCEIQHPEYGWISFRADQSDVEAHGVAIFERIQAAVDNGTEIPDPYVLPEPEPELTIQQKIARTGIPEGELVEYLVDQIQARLEN